MAPNKSPLVTVHQKIILYDRVATCIMWLDLSLMMTGLHIFCRIYEDRPVSTSTTSPFNGLFSRTPWVSRHQKGKPFWIYWSKRWWVGSGIGWTICKSFAPRCRWITTPVPQHSSFFYKPDALPATQPTASKHWRQEDRHVSGESSQPSIVITFLVVFRLYHSIHTLLQYAYNTNTCLIYGRPM